MQACKEERYDDALRCLQVAKRNGFMTMFQWSLLTEAYAPARDARAERHLPRDPMERLNELNALALNLPLFPPHRSAPRLTAELSNFVKDVRLCADTWEGLGRHAEAHALRAAALAGLAQDEMRTLAMRELAEPGAITSAITAHQMAQDEAAGAA